MMPLLSSAAGHLHFHQSEASVLNPGDLIATLDLDDPEAVTKAEPYAGGFPDLGPPLVYSSGVDHRFKRSLEDAKMILAGMQTGSQCMSNKMSLSSLLTLYCIAAMQGSCSLMSHCIAGYLIAAVGSWKAQRQKQIAGAFHP